MKVIYPLVTARYPWCQWLMQGLPVTLGLPLKKNYCHFWFDNQGVVGDV